MHGKCQISLDVLSQKVANTHAILRFGNTNISVASISRQTFTWFLLELLSHCL